MPDPKLVALRKEIEALLAKNDTTGIILLASPTHSEFLLKLDASWTCLRPEPGPDPSIIGLRFRCKQSDFPTKEAWRAGMTSSFNCLLGFHTVLIKVREMIAGLIKAAAANQGEITHWDKFEPPQ